MAAPATLSKEVAKKLLDIGVIKLNVTDPFTWTSGIKAPIYCDNRIINSNVEVRNLVVKAFVEIIRDKFPQVEKIAGIVTGGVPFGVLIADRMNLPFIYVRQKSKEHGLQKQVEGSYNRDEKVVLIEDHISTGGSSLNAVHGVRDAGLDILGLVSIMTYGFEIASNNFKEENVTHFSICNLDTVLEVAGQLKVITDDEKKSILVFRQDPHRWAAQ
jgi:orotate phosphoribosyltransferase